jgi:hypothetical protein
MQYIHDTQSRFYAENGGKNLLFKKSQKFQCAETVCAQIPLDSLMSQTFWIVPDKNHVYFEYPFFKLYAHPGNFDQIVDRVIELCMHCKVTYGAFSLHINFDGFTISAAERYTPIVALFSRVCELRCTGFTPVIESLNLYNVSSTIDHISAMLLPLIPPEMKYKIRTVPKKYS